MSSDYVVIKAFVKRTLIVRDLFHVFLNNVKIIERFLIYKPGIKVSLDITGYYVAGMFSK